MYKKGIFTIVSNEPITPLVYRMVLAGDTSDLLVPGRFVNIELDGFFLRRPISVCNVEGNELTIVYKTVGEGTKAMSKYPAGKQLDLLTGLGNGFDVEKSGDKPVLIGGGVGVPPMYLLCRRLLEKGVRPQVILGFGSERDIILVDEFRALGVDVHITTNDGSVGVKGFVTDVLKNLDYTYFYACGPEPMLKALSMQSVTSGQLSFEERMGCGFGACMGCSCETKYGKKRICKDGPVLEKEEIIW